MQSNAGTGQNSIVCSNQAAVEELQKGRCEEHVLRQSVCKFHIVDTKTV